MTRYQIKLCLVDVDTKQESGELFSNVSFEEPEYSMDTDWVMMKLLELVNEQIRVSLDHLDVEETETI